MDEWGTWFDVEPGTNPGFPYQQSTSRDALVAGLSLNVFHHHADRVHMGPPSASLRPCTSRQPAMVSMRIARLLWVSSIEYRKTARALAIFTCCCLISGSPSWPG
jgi:hypothetical protein